MTPPVTETEAFLEPPQTEAPPPRRRLGWPRSDWALIALPTALAAVLCLTEITTRSLGFDEAATVTIASQHGHALRSAIAHDGGNMSGFYVLLHVLMGWFGNGPLVLRLPSALASVVTVALVGMIGLRLFGRRAALAASLLAAVSLPLVFWAQNARGYAPMVAFVCAGYLVFIAQVRGGSGRGWIAYVLLMSLATYSSFVAVLVIPAQLLVLLGPERRRPLRSFGLSLVGIALLCIPLIVLAARRGSGQLFWVPRPTHEIDVQVLQSLTSAGLEPSFHSTATTTLALVSTLALLLVVTAASVPEWRRSRGWGGAMVVMWVLVPALLTFVYSLVFQPLFLPRNLLMSVPAVALLLGAGIGHRRLPNWAGLTLLVVLVGLRAMQLVPSYGVSPEPWREASVFVGREFRAGDCVAFYPADGRMAFRYYWGRSAGQADRLPRPILPVLGWKVVRTYVEDYATLTPGQLTRRSGQCRRLWFVSSHEGQADGPARSRFNRARYLSLRALLGRAYAHRRSRRFGYASAIHVVLLTSPRRR